MKFKEVPIPQQKALELAHFKQMDYFAVENKKQKS